MIPYRSPYLIKYECDINPKNHRSTADANIIPQPHITVHARVPATELSLGYAIFLVDDPARIAAYNLMPLLALADSAGLRGGRVRVGASGWSGSGSCGWFCRRGGRPCCCWLIRCAYIASFTGYQ